MESLLIGSLVTVLSNRQQYGLCKLELIFLPIVISESPKAQCLADFFSKLLHFILFADDTNIFFNHKDTTPLANTVKNELQACLVLVSANKLTLHPDKTKYIIFHPSRKKMDLTNCKIKINTTTISRVQSAKFRGIIIHQNLSWKPHIETICSKTSKVIGLICKARQYLLYIQTL